MTGSQHSAGSGSAKKMSAGLGLMLLGASLMGVALYSTAGPAAPRSTHLGEMISGTMKKKADRPTVETVEVRAGSWSGAADLIIAKLKNAGARRGQIISIDAHNNGPSGDAIFSAYWVPAWPDKGPLDINYKMQNQNYAWATFYREAGKEDVNVTDIISITGSCNSGGYSVLFNFYYTPGATHQRKSTIAVVESRASSWNGAANGVLEELRAAGVSRGQVISIDAHTEVHPYPDEDAIFSAFYDLDLPSYGDLDITYAVQNDSYDWATFYRLAAREVTAGVISITSSVNSNGNSVTYVFNYRK